MAKEMNRQQMYTVAEAVKMILNVAVETELGKVPDQQGDPFASKAPTELEIIQANQERAERGLPPVAVPPQSTLMTGGRQPDDPGIKSVDLKEPLPPHDPKAAPKNPIMTAQRRLEHTNALDYAAANNQHSIFLELVQEIVNVVSAPKMGNLLKLKGPVSNDRAQDRARTEAGGREGRAQPEDRSGQGARSPSPSQGPSKA